MEPERVEDVVAGLAAHDYLADDDLATAVFLALRMRRPLLLEGDAGVGKTEVARTLASWRGAELIRLQCHEGLDLAQAAYDWDHARQLLGLRAAEATGEAAGLPSAELRDRLYSAEFLVRRPLLRAVDHDGPVAPVLLVDEVDRADDEFEAFLLEVLSDYAITVPELGTFAATDPPVVVLTSNRTRDLHDALKRRCLYHWVEHPDLEREVAIIRLRVPTASARVAEEVAAIAAALRGADLYKPPGVSETVDWAYALTVLGADAVDPTSAAATLGAVLKYREDAQRVREHGLDALIDAALGGA
ncbi:AAA family ATPase [Euzebya sp.]|uniref:AAA family ATPase n=1 Tax=Euzebya sp. TaxID=1971409 RepID=UPI0035151E6A